MNRMNLNWRGWRTSASLSRSTFTVVFLFFVACYALLVVTDVVSINMLREEMEDTEEEALSVLYGVSAVRVIVFVIFTAFFLLLLVRTRRAIREHYRIPGSLCNDCWASCCCHVCVLSQMARQSADYHRHQARWCTDTGLSDDVEYGEFTAVVPDASTVERNLVV